MAIIFRYTKNKPLMYAIQENNLTLLNNFINQYTRKQLPPESLAQGELLTAEFPLKFAIKNGRSECVRLLIKAGLYKPEKGIAQLNMLWHAINAAQIPCVKVLLEFEFSGNYEGLISFEIDRHSSIRLTLEKKREIKQLLDERKAFLRQIKRRADIVNESSPRPSDINKIITAYDGYDTKFFPEEVLTKNKPFDFLFFAKYSLPNTIYESEPEKTDAPSTSNALT